jgi:hypothetical protein
MKFLTVALISAAIFSAESLKLDASSTHFSHKTSKASLGHNKKTNKAW